MGYPDREVFNLPEWPINKSNTLFVAHTQHSFMYLTCFGGFVLTLTVFGLSNLHRNLMSTLCVRKKVLTRMSLWYMYTQNHKFRSNFFNHKTELYVLALENSIAVSGNVDIVSGAVYINWELCTKWYGQTPIDCIGRVQKCEPLIWMKGYSFHLFYSILYYFHSQCLWVTNESEMYTQSTKRKIRAAKICILLFSYPWAGDYVYVLSICNTDSRIATFRTAKPRTGCPICEYKMATIYSVRANGAPSPIGLHRSNVSHHSSSHLSPTHTPLFTHIHKFIFDHENACASETLTAS